MKTSIQTIRIKGFILKSLYILTLSLFLAGCEKEEKLSGQSVVEQGEVKREKTELDQWIWENFTQPYGIEVEYRWNRNTVSNGNYVYPPEVDKVKNVLHAIKILWIDLYISASPGGSSFLSGKAPLKIYMYGGENVDGNGMKMLDDSEKTTNEMCLYNVNSFDPKDEDKVFILMRSVHHQFARRLMELFPYDRNKFLTISTNKYLESTHSIAWAFKGRYGQGRIPFGLVRYANRKGFLTYHSLLSVDRDFAEIISAKLTHTPKEILKGLIEAKTPYQDYSDPEKQKVYDEEARQAHKDLEEKIALVDDYFNKEIKISLNYLQLMSMKQIKDFTKQK